MKVQAYMVMLCMCKCWFLGLCSVIYMTYVLVCAEKEKEKEKE